MNKDMHRKSFCRTIEIRRRCKHLNVYYRGFWMSRLPYGLMSHFNVQTVGTYRIVVKKNKVGWYKVDKTGNSSWSSHVLQRTDRNYEVMRICNARFLQMFGAVHSGAHYNITITKVKVKNDK